jgi:aspartyl/asparaginyl beta-hydroxylase (cupin superfamily)
VTFPKLAPQIGKLSLTTGWAWLTSILCVMLLASSLPAQAVPVDVATTPSRHEIIFVEGNVADYRTLVQR